MKSTITIAGRVEELGWSRIYRGGGEHDRHEQRSLYEPRDPEQRGDAERDHQRKHEPETGATQCSAPQQAAEIYLHTRRHCGRRNVRLYTVAPLGRSTLEKRVLSDSASVGWAKTASRRAV